MSHSAGQAVCCVAPLCPLVPEQRGGLGWARLGRPPPGQSPEDCPPLCGPLRDQAEALQRRDRGSGRRLELQGRPKPASRESLSKSKRSLWKLTVCFFYSKDYHPDRQDIQKSMTAFKNHSVQCQEVWKRKELELQILTGAIRSWEGDNIKTLGSVVYMFQVLIQCAGSEEKNESHLLFPNILLMLSVSPRMSGFIYQGKLPTTGMTITKLEDSENPRNAFEISGSMSERILVSCNNQQDLHEWVDRLQKQTKAASAGNPSSKPHSVPSHTVRAPPADPGPGEHGRASGLSADASSSPVGCGCLTGTHL